MRWLDGIINLMYMNLSKLQEREKGAGKPAVLQSMGSQKVEHDWVNNNNEQCSKFSLVIYYAFHTASIVYRTASQDVVFQVGSVIF